MRRYRPEPAQSLMSQPVEQSPLAPVLPTGPGKRARWGRLYGSSAALAISAAAERHAGPVMVITGDTASAQRLALELQFFRHADAVPLSFPDWETLPYDVFSPHQDIISERLATLYRLPNLGRGVFIVPIATLLSRVCPREFLNNSSLILARGDRLDVDGMRRRLERAGYRYVSQVMEHGEFTVRGSLLDLFPSGASAPLRIDLLDDEVDSIRSFDPESQRSIEQADDVHLLPAREFPATREAIEHFRGNWRAHFEGDPNACPVYRDVSQGLIPAGIEYYLPLFFEHTESLFDYLPAETLAIVTEDVHATGESFWEDARLRYEQRRHDRERPLLTPEELFLRLDETFARLSAFPQIRLGRFDDGSQSGHTAYATRVPVGVPIDVHAPDPLAALRRFLDGLLGRALVVAETAGRREHLLASFAAGGLRPHTYEDWGDFLNGTDPLGITVAPLEEGAWLMDPPVAVITELQLFGRRAVQRRRRRAGRDAEAIVRDLAALTVGAPVVHEDHGVGRYRGLETLSTGNITNEYLCLEYDGEDKLYVPVASLHLVSRYTGVDPELAPLHRLGSAQWQKARRRAAEKAFDVAAELLEIYARRAARSGHAFDIAADQLRAFEQAFPFEETPDQEAAIEAVVADMMSTRPMDRLICGDVGFGKTEVAMRAAFVAVLDNRQVAILVPTTLLAQQHYRTFTDRFADWPVRVEQLSRFRSRKQRDLVVSDLALGRVDIVIGTHQLLQADIRFKRLGLAIIDEEHRFGVRQKERIKTLRTEVDVLTLTATPIPRTLNMAMSGLRDLSLIATPPERRLSIKTFVCEWNTDLLREAIQREVRRGGQVYVVHNKVETIGQLARRIEDLVPDASVRIGHGQMRERDLESTMLDFYHRRFNTLVCTTIIETGIDVPTANTIIINRADHFGLAQLHQLRGRVGRSHHRAYAYLVVPPSRAMTADAIKRLEAIESLEELGIGFTLATHDLEIRGAGELLGDEQSGQIQAVGYALYTTLLERAVEALRAGRSPELDRPLDHGAEIDLRVPALIPDTYLPDVHARLIMYKRIASAASQADLDELQVEMIDRFGPLPAATRTLMRITGLKIKATPLGLQKVEFGERGGRISFGPSSNLDPGSVVRLIQSEPTRYRLDGPEKLRLVMEVPDEAQRIAILHDLLDVLVLRNAA